jgi:ABC-2 type transport system ATP-binding protein
MKGLYMLKINNISKRYSNGYFGIRNFSLEVNNGEIVCLVGPNGSGKTTLINSIFGIIKPTSGTSYCDDFQNNTLEYKKNVVYITDELLLIEDLTGREYIQFVSKIYGNVNEEKINSLIKLFNMEDYIEEAIKTYSHGMKKKIQIITAFMIQCKVIVLDEPQRGLDVESLIILKKLIRKFVSKGGSVLLSTHDLVSAENICDKMAIISNGNVKDIGTINELKSKYNSSDIDEVFLKCSSLIERSNNIEKIIDSI